MAAVEPSTPQIAWVAVSALASALSAAIALIATTVNLWSIRRTGRATDFSNCLMVISQLAEAQRKVRDGRDEDIKQFEFRELLNLMEALALLENDRRVAPSTQKIAKKFLIETLAYIKSQPHLQTFMEASKTDTDTFGELRLFQEEHSIEIRDLSLHYERQGRAITQQESVS